MYDERPPRDIEHKAVTMAASPTPAGRRNAVRTTAVLGPSGVVHRGDVIQPGALTAAVRARAPRVAVGHDWRRPVGDVVGAVELAAGDPRLPRTTSDGQPWPARGGGCLLTVELMPSTTADATLAVKSARTVGAGAAWSFGFKITDGRTSGGLRRVSALSVYTVCPPATDTEAKGATRPADVEVKGVPLAASVPHTTGKRYAIMCGNCEQPVALANRPLRKGTSMICEPCIDTLGRLTDVFDLPDPAAEEVDETENEDTDHRPRFGEFDDEFDDDRAPRISSEDAYARAQDEEIEHDMQADGSLTRATGDRRWRP